MGGTAASAPILARRTINGFLGGGSGVNGGHQTLEDTEVVVDDLGQGGQAVGGARGVGHNLHVRLVGVLVDTHDKHGSVGRGSGDDDLLGATFQNDIILNSAVL